ncbi:hypothetical protein [Kitasatospora purpeofusca]|uniref:hypothetical protein n=1 Tax=Kitasatospora purpeofusca TaxID=67352 RepID=UPI00368CA4DB
MTPSSGANRATTEESAMVHPAVSGFAENLLATLSGTLPNPFSDACFADLPHSYRHWREWRQWP